MAIFTGGFHRNCHFGGGLQKRNLRNPGKPIERLYKPPMNTSIHDLAYAAVSEHVKLTHRLRVGVLSASPQELLTRAPCLMQSPELFKMTWATLRKMTKSYPREFQRLGVVVLRSRNILCSSGIRREG